jgi:hypothetical protein
MQDDSSNSSESATTTTTVEPETTTTTTQASRVLGDETKSPEQLGDEARAEALSNHTAEHAQDGQEGHSAPADA